MKVRDLLEMPLSRFDTDEYDTNIHGKVMQRIGVEQYKKRMTNQLKGVKEPVDIYFVPDIQKSKRYGRVEDEWGVISDIHALKQELRLDHGMNITFDPKAISLLIAGPIYDPSMNDDGNEIPMTPWMVAHRLAHAMMLEAPEGPREIIMHALRDVIPQATSRPHHIAQVEKYIKQFATMKSARNRTISQGELFIELFAQFMMKGTVVLNTPDPHLGGIDMAKTITDILNKRYRKFLVNGVGRVHLTR